MISDQKIQNPQFQSLPTVSPILKSVLPVLADFTTENKDFLGNGVHPNEGYLGPPRTKIIATLGPISNSQEKIEQLIKAGMNVARCNFSHEDHDFHRQTMNNVRAVELRTRKLCAVMLDTQGPEIRTGLFKETLKTIELKCGQKIKIRTNADESFRGDTSEISIRYAKLPNLLRQGSIILIDSGQICLKVESISNHDILCSVESDATLGSKKDVYFPGITLDLPAPTQKDVEDIKFGVEMGVDFIAASFVRKASDVHTIREILGRSGRQIQIISKIENQEGLKNFDEILEASDGIIVSRGNLGAAIPIEHVTLAQKLIIRKCNAVGKIVVTATQMLESMCENPTPTRAEASDIGNAVFDGTDCVMLTVETAKGVYPNESVKVMADICCEAERYVNYQATFRSIHERAITVCPTFSTAEAIASSAVKTAFDLKASLLVVLTYSGRTARLVSKYRPSAPILMITDSEKLARQGLVSRGLIPLLVGSITGESTLVTRAIEAAKSLGICKIGDIVVVVTGDKPDVPNFTQRENDNVNVIRVMTVVY